MPKLTTEQIQKIETFLANKIAKPCPVCGGGPLDGKQDLFLSLYAGIENKALNVVAVQCSNCSHILFFNFDTIIHQSS